MQQKRTLIVFSNRYMKYLIFFLLPLIFFSCLQERSWTTPIYKHLHYEVEIKNNIRKKVKVVSEEKDGYLILKFVEEKYCKNIQYDVENLYKKRSIRSSKAKYYMIIGSVLMGLALPLYYIGIFNSVDTARTINIGVGTTVFFIPGALMTGYGAYYKMREKDTTTKLGKVRRVIKSREFKCGTILKKSGAVEILSKIGYFNGGNINNKGEVHIKLKDIPPLYNEVTKIKYYEIFINKSSIGIILLKNSLRKKSKIKSTEKK
jgi:hypothetical protein